MMEKQKMQVILPFGAMGASEHDSTLDKLMRSIAVKYGKDEEWPDKYGTNIETDKLMMHRFCWCETDTCAWCGGCNCPETSYHYFVDGIETDYQGWMDFYLIHVYGMTDEEMKAKHFNIWDLRPNDYEEKSTEANTRRTTTHDPLCDYCLSKGIWEEFSKTLGAESGKNAPNFWHKPTNFKVWWYKYIGRSMETNIPITVEILQTIRTDLI